MTPDRWAEVTRLFERCQDLPPAERAAFVESACGEDAELRREIESLLAADSEALAEEFLDRPLAEVVETRPTSAGPYTLLEEIGQGGMGVVYKGLRRDQGFERIAAVKLVRRGMDTDFILHRFASERRILAGLDHPNVARVLDGGSTEDGRPYFVMELIEGRHLLEYCDQEALGIEPRLRLFQQVCAAVEYAHQRLVIHRDIKPRNILVTKGGVPKLLDVGLARIFAAGGVPRERTEAAQRALTPEYASPEQVRNGEITTSSDVYSLGVVLYELLTGRRPYPLEGRSPSEIELAICEEVPARPSSVSRRDEPIDTDVDTIVLHALAKEPERRYASVERLSDDISRYLSGRPVAARKDTVGYRARKFLSRHKTGTAAAVLVLGTLLVGIATTARQARIARAERARAEQRLSEVRRLTNSMLFEFHDSIAKLPGSIPARELLVRRALEYLATLAKAESDPSIERELASAYQKVGDVQGLGGSANLGDTAGALESYRAAQAILERLTSRPDADPRDVANLATCRLHLSKLFLFRMALDDALNEGRRSLAIRESLGSAPSAPARALAETGIARHNIGLILHLQGQSAEALAALEGATAAFDAALRRAPGDVEARRAKARSLFEIASLSEHSGDLPTALARAREALAIDESLLAADPNDARLRLESALIVHDIGEYEQGLGKLDESAADLGRALAAVSELSAADPKDVQARIAIGYCQIDLAKVLAKRGDPAASLRMVRSAVTAMDELLRSDPANGYVRGNLARACAGAGDALSPFVTAAPIPGLSRLERSRQARHWYRRSLDVYKKIQAGGSLIGSAQSHRDRVAAALARCEEALAETEDGDDPRAAGSGPG